MKRILKYFLAFSFASPLSFSCKQNIIAPEVASDGAATTTPNPIDPVAGKLGVKSEATPTDGSNTNNNPLGTVPTRSVTPKPQLSGALSMGYPGMRTGLALSDAEEVAENSQNGTKPDKVCSVGFATWQKPFSTCVDINTDGTFKIDLSCGPDFSKCIYFLVNSALEKKEKVLSFITLNALAEAGDTLLAFSNVDKKSTSENLKLLDDNEQNTQAPAPTPAIKGDIELGVVATPSANLEAVSSKSLTDNKEKFAESVESLILEAQSDNLMKMAKNSFINYDNDTNIYYEIVPRFWWKGKFTSASIANYTPFYADADGKIIHDAKFGFYGYQLMGRTNDPALFPNKFNENMRLEFYPPAGQDVRTSDHGLNPDGTISGQVSHLKSDHPYTTPLSAPFATLGEIDDRNVRLLKLGSTTTGNLMLNCDSPSLSSHVSDGCATYGGSIGSEINLGFGADVLVDMYPGNFILKKRVRSGEGEPWVETELAWFDIQLGFPIAGSGASQHPLVPLPAVKVLKNASTNAIIGITLVWYFFNPKTSTYEQISNNDFLMEYLRKFIMVGLFPASGGGKAEEYLRTTELNMTNLATPTFVPKSTWVDVQGDANELKQIQVAYTVNGLSFEIWLERE